MPTCKVCGVEFENRGKGRLAVELLNDSCIDCSNKADTVEIIGRLRNLSDSSVQVITDLRIQGYEVFVSLYDSNRLFVIKGKTRHVVEIR